MRIGEAQKVISGERDYGKNFTMISKRGHVPIVPLYILVHRPNVMYSFRKNF